MTPDDANDAEKHARAQSLFVRNVRASTNRPAPRTPLHAPRTPSATANSVRRRGVNGYPAGARDQEVTARFEAGASRWMRSAGNHRGPRRTQRYASNVTNALINMTADWGSGTTAAVVTVNTPSDTRFVPKGTFPNAVAAKTPSFGIQ